MSDLHPDMSERNRNVLISFNIAADKKIMVKDLQFVQMEYRELQVAGRMTSIVDNEHYHPECHVLKGRFDSQTSNIRY